MITGVTLDHIGIATEGLHEVLGTYCGRLSGAFLNGGTAPGFQTAQVGYGGGVIELMMPREEHENPFLRTYLNRFGAGPHHLTFCVPDLPMAIRQTTAAGYRVVGELLDPAGQQEAYVHPKDGPGILVQLVQVGGPHFDLVPEGMPEPKDPDPAVMKAIVLAVPELEAGRRLFVDLLGGSEGASGHDNGGKWIDVSWPDDRLLRLVVPAAGSSESERLGDRAGLVAELIFEVSGISEETIVAAPANHGTGLRLLARSA